MSAVPFGLVIDLWRSCRFIGALPGGIGRFMPCSIGANHCGLGHVGWKRCGHGLTSRPRKTALDIFLNELLVFLHLHFWLVICVLGIVLRKLLVAYLLGGCLLTVRLLGLDSKEVGVAQVGPREVGVAWVSGSGVVGKRVRLNRKTSAHLVMQGSAGVQSRSRVWKRLCIRVVDSSDRADAIRRRLHQHDWDHGPGHDRTGVG